MVVPYSRGEAEKIFWHIRSLLENHKLLGDNGLFNEKDFDLVGQSLREIETEKERDTATHRLAFTLNELEKALEGRNTKLHLTNEQKESSLISAKQAFMQTAASLFMSRWERADALIKEEMQTKSRKVIGGVRKRHEPVELGDAVALRVQKLKRLKTELMDHYWDTLKLGTPKNMIKPRKPGQLAIESFLPGSESQYANNAKKRKIRKRRH